MNGETGLHGDSAPRHVAEVHNCAPGASPKKQPTVEKCARDNQRTCSPAMMMSAQKVKSIVPSEICILLADH